MRTDVQRVRFPARRSFHADLKRRVEDFFEAGASSRHGGWAMGIKSAAMLAWLGGSYALLMFTPVGAWEAALLTVSIGLAMAGVGFSVMHDANHGGTSSSARMNGILSFTLDLIGGSSFLWRRKHNVLHHTYTNISALDPDLEGGGPLLRLAPRQRRDRLGGAPGRHHGGLRTGERAARLVSGRPELPGGAPPVPASVPPALSGAGQDRRGHLPRARSALPLRAHPAQRARGELA